MAAITGHSSDRVDLNDGRFMLVTTVADAAGNSITSSVPASTATRTQVADNAASVTILAANASRKGASVFNDSSATLHLALGSTAATTTNYTVKLLTGTYYEVPAGYTGIIVGIWASDPNDGNAVVTELT